MGARAKLAAAAAAIVMLPVMGSVGATAAGASQSAPPPPPTTSHPEYAICGPPASGRARCYAHVSRRGSGVAPDTTTSPTGLAPANIKSVYGFPTSATAGAGQTIGIVDAYDDPSVLSDFTAFNQQYGLTGGGTLTKVEQFVNGSPPAADGGWALEISLDVEWAHAIAPGANILLVEANDSSYGNLMAAEDYASTNGAKYVSNSWGGGEFCSIFGCETSYDSHFTTPGVSYFVAAGDSGLPAQYPSASPNVISVGGTTLHFDSTGAFTSETGWSSGGGGCSAVESANAAQSGFSQYSQVGCKGARATPDVALDADPNSSVSVYDTTPYNGQTGWWVVGGTSASTPMWAARSADQAAVVNASYVYGNTIGFRDITSGNNGAPCLSGYDLCSGRGSWLDAGGSTGGGGGGTDAAPTASISYTCSGATCTFTGSGSDVDSYAWSGAFAASGTPVTYKFTSSGSFVVNLTATDADSGETATSSQTVTCRLAKHNLTCH